MEQEEFISEPMLVDAGSASAAAMARGEPGLPTGFAWRGRHYGVEAVLAAWKSNGMAGDAAGYLRRHWFRVRVDTGQVMTVYCLRQAARGAQRWWLYSVAKGEDIR